MKIIKPEGLRFFRTCLEVSATKIAHKLGVTRQTIYNIENGSNPNIPMVICISIILLNALEKADIPQEIKEVYINTFCEEIDL